MARYAACFRARLHSQLATCQRHVKGLLHACRRNVERLNERLPDSSYDALHQFISVSDGDGQAVLDEVARRVQARRAAVTGEQRLLASRACCWTSAAGRRPAATAGAWPARTSGRGARLATGRGACWPSCAGAPRPGWWAGTSPCPPTGVPLRPGPRAGDGPPVSEQARLGGGPGRTPARTRAGAGRLGRPGRGLRQRAGPAPGLARAGASLRARRRGGGGACTGPPPPRRRPRSGRARAAARAGRGPWGGPWP